MSIPADAVDIRMEALLFFSLVYTMPSLDSGLVLTFFSLSLPYQHLVLAPLPSICGVLLGPSNNDDSAERRAVDAESLAVGVVAPLHHHRLCLAPLLLIPDYSRRNAQGARENRIAGRGCGRGGFLRRRCPLCTLDHHCWCTSRSHYCNLHLHHCISMLPHYFPLFVLSSSACLIPFPSPHCRRSATQRATRWPRRASSTRFSATS